MAFGCAHALERTGIAGDPASRVHRLDARAKVCGLLAVTLVAVSAPLAAWPAYAACALVLAAVAAVARVPAREVAARSAIVLPVVLLAAAFLPLVREDGLAVFATIAAKAGIGTVGAVLLAATTGVPAILHALGRLRVPRLAVEIAGFTYRYLFVLAAEVARMRQALAARGYAPRTALQAGALGRAGAGLLLRSHARGERVYMAMMARGYSGTVPRLAQSRFGGGEALFLVLAAGVPLAVRVVAEAGL